MRNLLAADMRRLLCSPIALGSIAMMICLSAGFVFMQTLSAREVGLERVILLFMSVYGIAASMLLGFLYGGEYSEGTLRNKLIGGRSRVKVYLSQTVISMIVCAAMYAMSLITGILLGVPLFDLHVSMGHEGLTAAIGLLCCMYYAALYTMITALCPGRTAAVAVNMAVSVGMLMLAVSISEIASGESRLWRIVLEAMPTGQAVLINEAAIDAPWRMALLDLGGMTVCTWVGAYALEHRDIC